jgi:hypothetical protein
MTAIHSISSTGYQVAASAASIDDPQKTRQPEGTGKAGHHGHHGHRAAPAPAPAPAGTAAPGGTSAASSSLLDVTA